MRAAAPEGFSVFGFDAWAGAPPPMHVAHRHDEVELNLLLAGTATYLWSGKLVRLHPDRLVVFWGAVPHNLVERGPGCELAWVTVPLVWVLEWAVPARLVERLLGGELIEPASSPGDRVQMLRWVEDRSRGTRAWKAVVPLEVEARLKRAALESNKAPVGRLAATPGAPMALVEQIARLVATRYREPLAVQDIAVALDKHPTYLMQLFKRRCGMTIGEYLLQTRLSHAQRLLTTTDMKIADVAFESGFGSLSQFYEAFARRCGATPRQVRARSARLR